MHQEDNKNYIRPYYMTLLPLSVSLHGLTKSPSFFFELMCVANETYNISLSTGYGSKKISS